MNAESQHGKLDKHLPDAPHTAASQAFTWPRLLKARAVRTTEMPGMREPLKPAGIGADALIREYWTCPLEQVMHALDCSVGGLTTVEAKQRAARWGANNIGTSSSPHMARLILKHFSNPLLLILVFAALISIALREWVDALVVILIVLASATVSVYQEHRASNAVAELRRRIVMHSTAIRDGKQQSVPSTELVPGDIVCLSAGNQVPADGIVIESRDFFVNQSVLSGETFPVEKRPGVDSQHAIASAADHTNCIFMGTSVSSGTATALIVRTGLSTEFGHIALKLGRQQPETEFEKGLRSFGVLLLRVMTLMVLAVLVINVLFHRATVDTLLFAIALAVGLSPELLPAILTVTLAQGSQKMAHLGVIVKRLNAIENLGSMTVLCTDKTGTLTQGVVRLDAAVDVEGQASADVFRDAYLNASLQTGLANALDQAIIAAREAQSVDVALYLKRDEIPYDFRRKRLSIVVDRVNAPPLMITKGALQNVLDICDRIQFADRTVVLDAAERMRIDRRFAAWSAQGLRVLGVAHREVEPRERYARKEEAGLCFCGFLLFFDPPEQDVSRTLHGLDRLGVKLKIITGDNHAVARHVAEAVGIKVTHPLTGADLAAMTEESLWHLAAKCNLFSEVDPHQKERVVRALQKSGQVVGFLGDGINDAPALQAADVGISVDRAVDVAREAADLVLLRHDLNLIRLGIDEGRHTFANTLKYVFITTSANFGNMISMAAAALVLPFLPLLAKQVLLNNFLSDIPALGIAGDNVDREWDRTPHRWNVAMIRSFMISFGLISTLFDLVTFGVLLYLVGESPALFRTGWFVESLLTELFILLVIRTYKPFYRARPGRFLMLAIWLVAALTIALPYLPFARVFGLVPLPLPLLGSILVITLVYLLVSEATKRRFYRRFGFGVR